MIGSEKRMRLEIGYLEDDRLRAGLNALTRAIYGFDFEAWYRGGFADGTYIPFTFFEGDEAVANVSVSELNKALSGGFDLILLDLMLPGLDGFTICKKLREKLDIPILMVTARTQDIDKIRGLGFGADDYIEKPFSPSVLVARVKANLAQYERLRPAAKAADSIISVGPFVMDSDAAYGVDRRVRA